MIKISNKQMEVFSKEIRKPKKKELQEELVEMFPALSQDELFSFIETGLKKIEKYGIYEHTAVKDFIRLMIVVSEDFDEYPPANELLTRIDVTPNLRVQLMCELLTPIEWQEAKKFGKRASDRIEEDYVQKEISDILSA